jgi:hypothetical protein
MHTQIVVVALGTAGAVLATFENARGVAPTKGDRSQAEVYLPLLRAPRRVGHSAP